MRRDELIPGGVYWTHTRAHPRGDTRTVWPFSGILLVKQCPNGVCYCFQEDESTCYYSQELFATRREALESFISCQVATLARLHEEALGASYLLGKALQEVSLAPTPKGEAENTSILSGGASEPTS